MFEGDGKDELVPNLTEFSVEVPLEADVTEVRRFWRAHARICSLDDEQENRVDPAFIRAHAAAATRARRRVWTN